MSITVDNKGVNNDGQRLIYDLYYFDSDQYYAPTPAAAFKIILIKWAKVLQESNRNGATRLFLPFDLDDEWTKCLRADLNDDRVILRYVKIEVNGYEVDVDHLENFMTSTHGIEEEGSELFGDYDNEEFISALINAQVIKE